MSQTVVKKVELSQFPSFFKNKWLVFGFFLGLILLVYLNSFFNGFISDDIQGIAQNPRVTYFQNVTYAPLMFLRPLFVFIITNIFGMNPFFLRLLNILFHLGTVLGIYKVLKFMTKREDTAFFTAAIFAVLPVLTEGVSWISGGAYPQYTFFLMWAFYFYISQKDDKKIPWISLILFFFAIVSYHMAIAFPGVLFVYEWLFGSWKKNWKKYAGFFVMAGAWILLYLPSFSTRSQTLQTNFFIQAGYDNLLIKLPFAITSYLQLIFFPFRLTLYHAEPMGYTEYAIRCVILLLFFGLMWLSYLKNKKIFFGLSLFLISLAPVLTPLRIASTVGERYVYFGAFGMIFAFVIFVQILLERWKALSYQWLIFAAIILAFSVRTIYRNMDWRDEYTFWVTTAQTSPTSAKVFNNLGITLTQRQQFQAAEQAFMRGIQLDPNDLDAYHNLGYLYLVTNHLDEALKYYEAALKVNPNLWQFHNDVGAVYLAKKDYKKAEQYFMQAAQLMPNNSFIHINLARVYIAAGDMKKAEAAVLQAVRIDNGDPAQVPIILEQLKAPEIQK